MLRCHWPFQESLRFDEKSYVACFGRESYSATGCKICNPHLIKYDPIISLPAMPGESEDAPDGLLQNIMEKVSDGVPWTA